MASAPPTPVPQLESAPPTPPGLAGGAPPADASFQGLAPQAGTELVGSLQMVQLTLETAQAVAQGLDILGKIHPNFSALSTQLQVMLKDGIRSTLQQGAPGSEPSAATFQSMGGGF